MNSRNACRPCFGVAGASRLRGSKVRASAPAPGFRLPTSVLYIVTVLIWGTSWYAMELQLVLPGELAIAYRFVLAATMLAGF